MKQKRKGFLISFEGGEGSGKSSQIKRFVSFLENEKIEYVLLHEPGGTPFGEKIREILLHGDDNLSAKEEFLLFCASRARLVETVMKPALAKGKVVVMDRYFDSSLAYQGFGDGLNLKCMKKITKFTIGDNAVPDLTFLFDVTYEMGMARKSADEKLKNLDRFETKEKKYHDRMLAGYRNLAKHDKHRFVTIDTSASMDEVTRQVIATFKQRFFK